MAKQPRRDKGSTEELEAAFEEVLTSAARAAAERCAEVCRARIEEARSEERVRILLEPRGGNGQLHEPLLLEAIPVAWTRGFYDGKFAHGSLQGLHCRRSLLGQPTTDLSAMVYASDSSSQGERGLDYVALLRSTFNIRDAIHKAVLAKREPDDRPKSKRTCDLRSIVSKVHAVWQDRLLEDEAPATLTRALTTDSVREVEPEQKVVSARSRRFTATALGRGSVLALTFPKGAAPKGKLGRLKEKVSLGLEAIVHSGRTMLHHVKEEGGEVASPGAPAQGPRVSPGSLPPSPEQSPTRRGGGSPLRDGSAEAAPAPPTEASPATEKRQGTPVLPAWGSQLAERPQAPARAATCTQLAAPDPPPAPPTSPFRKPEAPARPMSPIRAAAEQPAPPWPPLERVPLRAEAPVGPVSPVRAAAEQPVPPPTPLERVPPWAEAPARPVSPVRASAEQPAPAPPLERVPTSRAEASAAPPAAAPPAGSEPPGLRAPQLPTFPRRPEAEPPEPAPRPAPRALSRGATTPSGASADALREQSASNRDLSRTLAELTALLQEAHIIGTSPRTTSPARREGGSPRAAWKLR